MEVWLLLVTGVLNILCFFIGAKVGQQASKGETITAPEVNPVKIVRERHERRIAEEKQSRMDVIMKNIETYDGTSIGQEEVPM